MAVVDMEVDLRLNITLDLCRQVLLHLQFLTLRTKNSNFYYKNNFYSTNNDIYKCIAVGTNNPSNGDIMYFIAKEAASFQRLIYIIKIDFLSNSG